eukprot:g25060.t1
MPCCGQSLLLLLALGYAGYAFCPRRGALHKPPSLGCHLRQMQVESKMKAGLTAAIPGCNLVPFGSAATGLWVPGRDVDLSLKVAGVRGRIETKSVLHRVALTINRFSGEKPENRLSAKMPLLRWIPPTSWEKDGTGCDPSFDITVNNDLAVENSRLVSAYLAVEPLLKPMSLRKLFA